MRLYVIDRLELPRTRATPAGIECFLTRAERFSWHLYFDEVRHARATDEQIRNATADRSKILDTAAEIPVTLHYGRLIAIPGSFNKSSFDSRHVPLPIVSSNPLKFLCKRTPRVDCTVENHNSSVRREAESVALNVHAERIDTVSLRPSGLMWSEARTDPALV